MASIESGADPDSENMAEEGPGYEVYVLESAVDRGLERSGGNFNAVFLRFSV